MTQTLAIFIDAYRELNARKLFWVTLILSAIVVAAFAFVGINEQGMKIFIWDFPMMLNTTVISEETFYKTMFVSYGIKFWLTWLAAILALISTASIFPDYISGGAIDTVLSKPIGRWRLFFTKYATGLMFVGLQVSVFCVVAFLIIGMKGGAWEPSLFLAIPLVVIFFSYLFCVCTLLGLITRSTIASLLLTLLFWLLVFAIHTTEATLLMVQNMQQQQVKNTTSSLQHDRDILQAMRESETPDEQAITRFETSVTEKQTQLEQSERLEGRLGTAHRITMGVKTVLPKTTETVQLLERWLIDLAELPSEIDDHGNGDREMEQAQQELVEAINNRSVWWVLGTSLLFEAVVLLFAGWLFVRRDF